MRIIRTIILSLCLVVLSGCTDSTGSEKNAEAAMNKVMPSPETDRPVAIIPQPVSMQVQKGNFTFSKKTKILIDVDTLQIVDCNETAEKIYGYTREEFNTMTPHALHYKDDPALEINKMKDKKNLRNNYTHVTKNGRELQVEVHSTIIEYNNHCPDF